MRALLCVAVAIVLALPQVSMAQQTTVPPDTAKSRIMGKLLAADGNGPLAGATVHAYHLSSETVYSSPPSTSAGDFEILGLPYGYFDMAIETPQGLFVGNQVVNVPPGGKVSLVFTAVPFAASDADAAGREFPGSDQTSIGIAQLRERLAGRAFWRSPKGVAILASTAGVALLAIASGGDDDNDGGVPSPSTP
jgi:hypothetical protein